MIREGVVVAEEHAHYGEVIYDAGGFLVCHVCGKGGLRHLGSHITKQHKDMFNDVREYKIMFGLDFKKGLIVPSLKDKMRKLCFERGGVNNLDPNANPFQKGGIGHPKSMVSEQSRRKQLETIQQYNNKRQAEKDGSKNVFSGTTL